MYVQRNIEARSQIIVATETQLCIPFVLLTNIGVNNIMSFIYAMETQQRVPLHSCRATKHFVLMSVV
jgi:hypothetical protein